MITRHSMETWQVFDASTSELLAQLDLLGSPSSDASRLAALIHQELVERGHLNQFLDSIGLIQDEPGPESTPLLQRVHETHSQQAVEVRTSTDDSQRDLAADSGYAQHTHDDAAQPDLPTATANIIDHSTAAATETLEVEASQHLTANANNAGASIAIPHASSVLDAAVAAYKQEKRQLWKAKKAGMQAGWGFTKPHPSWPKPDKSAGVTLGPLRRPCKAMAHGSSSQLQRIESCKAPPARTSAAQAVHKAHQVEAPQTTASNTSPCPSQPLSGSSLFVPDHMAVQHLSPGVVATHEQQQQHSLYVPGNGLLDTQSQHTAEVLRTPASVNGQGESASLQHGAAGVWQQHSSGSVSDGQCPQTAANEAWQNDVCGPSAEPLQKSHTAMLWHRDAVYHHQHSGLQVHVDAQLADTEEVPGTPSQSSSEVDAERVLQQNADSCNCTAASGHLGHLDMEGSTSGLSSRESECVSSAELGAVIAGGDRQDAQQPSILAGVPTSSWFDRPTSSDHSSEACSESSEADTATASRRDGLQQEAAVASAAPHHHQHWHHTAHRLNEWNMPGDDGLCSWPTTPLHDPSNHLEVSPHLPQGRSHIHLTGMRKSVAKNISQQADRLITFAHGERLMLG